MRGPSRGARLVAGRTRARFEGAALDSAPETLWKLASRHVAEIRLDALPASPESAAALWSATMPDGRIRVSRSRGLRDPGVNTMFEVRGRWVWPRRRWYLAPRPLRDIRDAIPAMPAGFLGATSAARNLELTVRSLRSDHSPAPNSLETIRKIGLCIATDEPNAKRSNRVLARMDALTPPGVEISAVVVTGTRSVEPPTMKLAEQLDGAVRDVFVLHDDDEFLFARRVNRGAHALFERHSELDALIIANDDTVPTALACHRIANWPKSRALVSAVSNKGGGGLQDAREFFELDYGEGELFPSPHRLAAFFLYITVDAWRDLLGFDERFDGYGCDDTDLSLRAAAMGLELLIDLQAFVWHVSSASFGQDGVARLSPRARERFLRKYPEIEIYTSPLPLPAKAPRRE